MEQLSKLLELTSKLAPASTLGVAIACSIVIFIPDALAIKLGVDEFRISNKGLLGWSLILCSAYMLATLVFILFKNINTKLNRNNAHKKYIRKLHDLTRDEKQIILQFMDGKNTVHCSDLDAVSGGLEAKGIIYSPVSQYSKYQGIPYNLQSWARKYFKKNPELLLLD